MMLKALGIKITDEDLMRLEAFLPQIPEKAVQLLDHVNHVVQQLDERLQAIECVQKEILERLNEPTRITGNGVGITTRTRTH